MNILMITATYAPSANGVATSIKRTVDELRKQGHRVWIIGPKCREILDGNYIVLPTIFFPGTPLHDYPVVLPYLSKKQLNHLQTICWDIVHAHHPVIYGVFSIWIKRLLGAPLVFTYHSQYDRFFHTYAPRMPKACKNWVYQRLVIDVCNNADGIIAPALWLKKALMKRIISTPVYYATTAGLPRKYATKGNTQHIRKRLALDGSGPIFITVARLTPEKNLPFLISAFFRWAKKNPAGSFVIVGDGLSRRKLVGLAQSLGLVHRIIFVGRVSNDALPKYLAEADVFIYASISDTIGINLLEAMSAGLPVVAFDDITSREVVRDGMNGLLAKDEESFAEAMTRALKLRVSMSRNAIKTANRYLLTKTTSSLICVYEQIVNKYHR